MVKGLGKGVGALFKNMSSVEDEQVQQLLLKDIRPNPYQPRKVFKQEALEELTNSIREHGVLQPIIVRKSIKGFEIVVGERRFRASMGAGLDHIPAVVRELSDKEMMELAVLENLQREDLTPMEEARSYEVMMVKLNMTQDQLAKTLGKSRPHIANHIRLLGLPEEIQDKIAAGELSMGHGRALLGLKKKASLQEMADRVIKEKLNVRQLEKLVQEANNVSRETKKASKPNPFYREHEGVLRERFGTGVAIKKGKTKGKIEIEFMSDDDLDRILSLINVNQHD
ncbi:ParB/RepB/Spo0J family partition protein [Jeotgalibacillus proteolyticus]|uniref:Chromosome partitioning protein ParB n=1 Tax=Jeotgalibacillus proteolyticus TaxID=2082395 RepID=A0A2S5G679_9BACL|nr:ParB/RepB/Spo0J family partition protein [Jeotgalibacillus proteolyticus]PPA68486.1 chromosome partitioning protein ParB [Jeotgalibacillus proteolyticus]